MKKKVYQELSKELCNCDLENFCEKEIIFLWINLLKKHSNNKKPRKIVEEIIIEAYENNYQKFSDGCTFVDEFEWPIAHPTCVGHDYLYSIKRFTRFKSDLWFLKAMIDFGHPIRGFFRFIGVLIFGYFRWRKINGSQCT